MENDPNRIQRFRGIAFLGNYLPRNCGIATFTYDLSNAIANQTGVDQEVIVAAMNDIPEGYVYPDQVRFEIRQDHLVDYSRAADFINFSNIDVVSLQHEYGIYGGEKGANVLTFLKGLNAPVVTTCHTVLEEPTPKKKELLCEIAERSEKLVVMSRRAFGYLENAYGIPSEKIVYIPHGIHDAPFIDPNYYKDKFGVEGRKVLLTFGLLDRYKGIEYMIEALPDIVKKHPKTTYVILGVTHPASVRLEGEAYRLELQRRVRELGLEDHVLFYPRFVETDVLLEYLGAADVFVTPYVKLEQITSGALSYAMGAGKAVISTPYWHAEELLADNRGVLVAPKDSKSLAEGVNKLLDDEVEMSKVRKRAYNYCRGMIWSSVARAYLDLFDELRSHLPVQIPTTSSTSSPIAPTNVPSPILDHLIRLTDDTGPSRYARYTIPNWNYGYALSDAALTALATTRFYGIFKDQRSVSLLETCVALLQTLAGNKEQGNVAAGMNYARDKAGRASDVDIGMMIRALAYVVWKGPRHLEAISHDLFHQVFPKKTLDSPRAASYAVLGACHYLQTFPGASAVKRFLKTHLQVIDEYVSTPSWNVTWDSPDWPMVPQVYCAASELLDHADLREKSAQLVDALREATSNGTTFIGQGDNSDGEELPTTAATFIESLAAFYHQTRDPELLTPIRSAVDWFLGTNRRKKALYDFSTGGCHDALTNTGRNRNQGTEATVRCLMAFLSLNKVFAVEDQSVSNQGL